MTGFSRSLALAAASALAFSLVACSSGPAVDPQLTAAVAAKNVGAPTATKMEQGRVLGYADIVTLVRKDVPTHIIVSYLQSTEKVYRFSSSQLQGLRSAGASPQLLNYLNETQGFYGYRTPAATARVAKGQKDAYYNDPAYQDEQPFAYNEPIIDDWYDSAYEESLYSPFSMD